MDTLLARDICRGFSSARAAGTRAPEAVTRVATCTTACYEKRFFILNNTERPVNPA
jgi:hypothetical protein